MTIGFYCQNFLTQISYGMSSKIGWKINWNGMFFNSNIYRKYVWPLHQYSRKKWAFNRNSFLGIF